MEINGNYYLNTLARGDSDALDWAVAPVPVPEDRFSRRGRFTGLSQFVTWSGGWRYALPEGVNNPQAAWQALRFLTSLEGHLANALGEFTLLKADGKAFVPRLTGNIRADRAIASEYLPLLPKHLANAQWFFIEQLAVARYRPISPLASQLLGAVGNASRDAAQKGMPPRNALENRQREIQSQLDTLFGQGLR